MHLFIIHQFPDLDNFAPIIYNLKKKGENVSVLNLFPVNDFKKISIGNFLLENKVHFYELRNINILNKILFLLIKIVLLFNKKNNYIFYNIYHKLNLFSSNQFSDFLKRKKIKTISLDTSLPNRFQKIIFSTKNKNNINVIKYGGAPDLKKEVYIDKEKIYNCDYFITSNKAKPKDLNGFEIKKIKSFESIRFTNSWIKTLSKISKSNKKRSFFNSNKSLKILIFHRPLFPDKVWFELSSNLKSIDNFEVVLKLKPRGIFPIQYRYKKNEIESLSSSELIDWADVILTHSTSLVLEALIKKKKIFYLSFFSKNRKLQFNNKNYSNDKYIFENYSIFDKIDSSSELIKKLRLCAKDKKKFKNNKVKIQNFFNKELDYNYEKDNFNIYYNFYKRLI